MTFNGINADDIMCAVLTAISISPMPKLDAVTKTFPGRRGALLTRRDIGPKNITLTFTVIGPPAAAAAASDRLNQWLWTESPQRLYLDDDPGRYYEAVLTSTADSSLEYGTKLSYTLTALSGVKYGQERMAAVPGTAYCSGTAGASWVLCCTLGAATTNPVWACGNSSVGLDGSYAAGTDIEIRSEEEVVMVNGDNAMPQVVHGSRFWKIAPGANEITGPHGILTFKEEWL